MNSFKDKAPLQILQSLYLSILNLLIKLFTTLKTHTSALASHMQAWIVKYWPLVMQQLLMFAQQLRRLITNVVDKSVILCRYTLDQIRKKFAQYWPSVKQRLMLYIKLTRLDKPTGILLLLWPTLWAVWIAAEGHPGLHLFLVFTLGVVLTRSAGCVLNDMVDRKYDVHVSRTALRPLATGLIKPDEALTVACVLLLLAFLLVLTTNRFTVMLSFVAIPLAILYPLMKRYTYLPQFFLGLAFSWGIPMAFAAQSETIPNIAWLLFIANILWTVVYDTIYAMVDREDDRKIGIKSTAILFDDADKVMIGILQLMFLAVMIIIGIQMKADMLYYVSLAPAGVLMIYHQYLIRHRTPEGCFRAFLNNHWIGFTIFAGIYL